jgi:hypothetical protein
MKRSKPLSALILIVLALLLSGAKGEIAKSKNPRANQHQSETIRHPDSTGNQELQIPLAVWQRNQAALNESIATVKEQAEAAKRQADAYKETWRSPSVLVQIVLTFITGGFLIYAGLQWRLSERALIVTNRAYVNIENATIKDWATANGPVVSYELRNSGKVPATGVVTGIGVSKGQGIRPDPKYVQKTAIGAGDRALVDRVIAPGETITQSYWLRAAEDTEHGTIPPLITDADLSAVLEGERFMTVRIEVAYWDGFDKHSRMTAKYFAYIGGRIEDWGGRQE